jgi:integrase
MAPKPDQWTLQKTSRPKGAYYQAVWGRPPGRRRTITLGYVSQEEADTLLLGLRLQGAKLVVVVLPDGQLVPFDDPRAPQGRSLYDDDSIRLGARVGASGDQSFDAHLDEAAFKAAVQSGDLGALPLREFLERVFSPVREREVAPATWKRERQIWGQILPVLGDLQVKAITGLHVERFLTSRTTWGGGVRKVALATLRALLKYAVEIEVLDQLPRLRPVRGATKRVRARPVAILPEQVAAILDHASTPVHRAIFALAFGQGLRPSEASGTDWGDVDWQRGLIHVRGTKTALSDRTVPLTPATLTELRPYWEGLGKPTSGPAFIFRGKPFREWENAFSGAARRAGLEINVNPYLARHTFATSCALAGVPKAVTKEMLGHSEKSELLESAYTNPHSSQIAAAMQALTRLGG